jgi:hypothetical protein
MISLVEVQSALIQWMKANLTISGLVPSTHGVEIREAEWQGDKFVYPNIRVHVLKLTPDTSNCSKSAIIGNVYVFSEQFSSLECNTIAGVILEQLHGKSFNVTLPSTKVVHFVGMMASQNAGNADPEGGNVWMGTINLTASVN